VQKLQLVQPVSKQAPFEGRPLQLILQLVSHDVHVMANRSGFHFRKLAHRMSLLWNTASEA
jgi:hypothetical protein